MTQDTTVYEVAEGIFRINTPVSYRINNEVSNFTFNQYLILDDEALLFHTGPRRLFPAIRDAVGSIMPVEQLRYVAFSHVESDECGSLNEWLAAAPRAVPVCSVTGAVVSIADMADREPRPLADGERLSLGIHDLTWIDTPQLPHGWECGYLFESRTKTLLCGDLFTQGGAGMPPISTDDIGDILEASEKDRKEMDYYSHTAHSPGLFEKLIAMRPRTLACMHGSAWEGDGAKALAELAAAWISDSKAAWASASKME